MKFKGRNEESQFQSTLRNADVIRNDSNIYVKEDKGAGYVKVDYKKYDNWKQIEIMKEFKKVKECEQTKINKKELKIAESLNLDNRIEICSKSETEITIKATSQIMKATQNSDL